MTSLAIPDDESVILDDLPQLVRQIGVRNKHDTGFCDEELKFGTFMEETMKSETDPGAKYYRS